MSPALSSSCRAPALLFALLAKARTEWAPLCCFPSSSHQAEPQTWEEEKDGGRKGMPPPERGQQPRHYLPLDSPGAERTNPAKPMWGLHSLFPGLCLHFPGCVSHRSYRAAGQKDDIQPNSKMNRNGSRKPEQKERQLTSPATFTALHSPDFAFLLFRRGWIGTACIIIIISLQKDMEAFIFLPDCCFTLPGNGKRSAALQKYWKI